VQRRRREERGNALFALQHEVSGHHKASLGQSVHRSYGVLTQGSDVGEERDRSTECQSQSEGGEGGASYEMTRTMRERERERERERKRERESERE